VALLVGSHSSSGNEKKQTEAVLDWPAGRWLVGVLGAGLVAWGLGSAYRGVTKKFKDDLHTARMSARAETWATRVGVVGYLARAIVYALAGVFLIRAAYEFDPKEAVGLDGALQKVADQRPSGPFCSASSPQGSSHTGSSTSCGPPTARSDERCRCTVRLERPQAGIL
jgi:hypothetical protein